MIISILLGNILSSYPHLSHALIIHMVASFALSIKILHYTLITHVVESGWVPQSLNTFRHSKSNPHSAYSFVWLKIHHIFSYQSFEVPYSRLFSLGANFPNFHELAHNPRKFILGCYVKFDCGSLLWYLLNVAQH